MEIEKVPEREELLKRLHAISFHMDLVALTSEYCIEMSAVFAKGTYYAWESFDDYGLNAYSLNGISKNKLATIKEHIQSKSLFLSDLNRTQLKKSLDVKDKTQELSEFFVDFLELPDEKIDTIYCYKDTDTGCIYVSAEPEKISDILNERFPVCTPWEDMEDEELMEYLMHYEGCKCEIPFTYFD